MLGLRYSVACTPRAKVRASSSEPRRAESEYVRPLICSSRPSAGIVPIECTRESQGETTVSQSAQIGRAPDRSRRVKNALKVGNEASGSAASDMSTP
jgi:hypothetical protein